MPVGKHVEDSEPRHAGLDQIPYDLGVLVPLVGTGPVILLACEWQLAQSAGPSGSWLYGDWSREWDPVFEILSGLFVISFVAMAVSFFVLPLAWLVKARMLRAGKWIALGCFLTPLLSIAILWIDPFHMVSWLLD